MGPVVNSLADVTVVVVNWNSGDLLRQCVEQLFCQTILPRQILILDNGSSDLSLESIQKQDNLSILALDANVGFAAANNLAFSKITTSYVVLLNPDAFPDPDWLQKLVEATVNYPDVAAFGSRQMIHGLDKTLDGTGDVYHCSGLVWRNGYGQKHHDSDMADREIFSPCACAALYRLQVLQEVGGFDEDFFCYVEDVDLGFRLRLAGYRSMYIPGAVISHVGSACSDGQDSDFAIYHGHRNLIWSYVKNMPGLLFWIFLPLHLLLNLVSVIWFTVKGQGKVIIRAKVDAMRSIAKMWRKRRMIQAKRRASILDIWRVLDRRLFKKKFSLKK